jgi:hypothetical protein
VTASQQSTPYPSNERCGSLSVGHDVDHNQIMELARQHPSFPVDGLDAPGDDVVRISVDGFEHRLHNHAPTAVLAAWRARIGTAHWTPGAALLRIPRRSGTVCFGLSTTSPGLCADAIAEQARTDASFVALIDVALIDTAHLDTALEPIDDESSPPRRGG